MGKGLNCWCSRKIPNVYQCFNKQGVCLDYLGLKKTQNLMHVLLPSNSPVTRFVLLWEVCAFAREGERKDLQAKIKIKNDISRCHTWPDFHFSAMGNAATWYLISNDFPYTRLSILFLSPPKGWSIRILVIWAKREIHSNSYWNWVLDLAVPLVVYHGVWCQWHSSC